MQRTLFFMQRNCITWKQWARERNDTKEKNDIFLRIADDFYAYYTTPARLCNPTAQVRFLAFYISVKPRYSARVLLQILNKCLQVQKEIGRVHA
jgi:hypothetical protein